MTRSLPFGWKLQKVRPMTVLRHKVRKIRSKNAGPFWLTLDIFCFDEDNFTYVRDRLATATIAALFQSDEAQIKRFDIADLQVIKFSLPRPQIQGTQEDTDMHGAAYAALLEELELD